MLKKIGITVALITIAAVFFGVTLAFSAHGEEVSKIKLFVNYNVCGPATVTLANDGGEGVVTGGNLFDYDTAVPAAYVDPNHDAPIPGRLGVDVIESGTYSVSVSYNDERPIAVAFIQVDIPECVQETPPTSVDPAVQPEVHILDAAVVVATQAPMAVETTPGFTG